jgi:hypothetical protein
MVTNVYETFWLHGAYFRHCRGYNATLFFTFINMKHVSILVPNEAVLASIEDPRYMFTAVNEFLEASGRLRRRPLRAGVSR